VRKAALAFALLGIIATAALTSCSNASKGKRVFTSELCPACHYFRGIGKEGGIDLSNVGQRRSRSWIKEHIRNPRSHDPNIGMPSFAHLSRSEIDSLVKFLTSRDKG
jgi:cytochrome c2